MKILFIEPRSPAEHVFSMSKIPRLGTVILGTIMRDLGHQVRVLVEEIGGEAKAADLAWADLVGISTITSTAPRAYALGDLARRSGKKVVYGGPHVTFLPGEALGHGDFVVRGEGEEALPELVSALEEGRDPSSVAGLSFRRGDGTVDNADRPLVSDLDRLPIPDFSLVRGWGGKGRIVPVATSRGCPFNCKFCSVVPMFGRRLRVHSVGRVMAEVRRNSAGASYIFFCDDNFTADPRRAKELLRAMIAEGVGVKWGTQVRVDAARDHELMDLMKRAGCRMVYIGFESINPKTLAAIRKQQSPEEIRHAIGAFHDHGIRIHGMFIVGADQDAHGSVAETMRFARRMRIDSVQFMMLTPLPGTETFRELEEAGRLLTREWHLYDGSYAVFRPRLMTAYDLQGDTLKAYSKFYSWASVVRRALNLDLAYTTLRLLARLIVVRSRRRLNLYKRSLKAQILERSRRRLAALAEGLPRQKRALLAGTIEEPYLTFFRSYLRRLGVKVRTVDLPGRAGETAQAISAELRRQHESLKRRSALLVVPFIEGIGAAGARGQESLKVLRSRLEECLPPGLHPLPLKVDLEKSSLYHAAVDLGTAFSGNLRRIRRAYLSALAESHLKPWTAGDQPAIQGRSQGPDARRAFPRNEAHSDVRRNDEGRA